MAGRNRRGEEAVMTFEEVVDQAIAMLQRQGRVTYRMLICTSQEGAWRRSWRALKVGFIRTFDPAGELLNMLNKGHLASSPSQKPRGASWQAVFP
jgi:hypothetical protein